MLLMTYNQELTISWNRFVKNIHLNEILVVLLQNLGLERKRALPHNLPITISQSVHDISD
jgi:hypothetical protein